MSDALSALLRELRLESAHYRLLRLDGLFRIAFEQEGIRGVHIIRRGVCELHVRGLAPRRLHEGDLVIAPRADPHQLCAVGARRAPLTPSLAFANPPHGKRLAPADAETSIVCGAFVFHQHDHPALAGLPRLIHVRGEAGRPPAWLAAYVDALTDEAAQAAPGSEVVMARLSDALVARALREALATDSDPGWLRGLRDPQLARVLGALHDDLAKAWTLPELARLAGMSRASLAARFTEQVGEPPMRYLLTCRMRRAMSLLRARDVKLADVAAQVGYGSEAALSAAFKRHTGRSPGAYARGSKSR